jgi:glucose-1-phosphate cytidylyltransferase
MVPGVFEMKVVILAGGMGTRLREETEYRPKPMVLVGGKPLLWHIMKIYDYFGFHDFVICLGYKGDMIKKYFLNYETMNSDFTINLGNRDNLVLHNDHTERHWNITLAETGETTMTGARIKRIEKYIDDETFMLTYGDAVSDINIAHLLDFHFSHGKIGTVTGVHPPSRFGELHYDSGYVKKFNEKPSNMTDYISGGFFVFNRDIFSYLNDANDCALEDEPLSQLATDGQLMIYRHNEFWQCCDTYRELEILNRMWKTNPPWRRP